MVSEIVQSSNDEYDVICDGVFWMAQHVLSDFFWCLDDVEDDNIDNYIDLSKSYWDQRCNENLSLMNRHFLIAGDAIVTDDDHTYATIFNKDMIEEYAFENPYDLVDNGEWTLDKYREMALVVGAPDENGQWGVDATWGSLAHNYASTIMLNGSGISIIEKDENGYPAIRINSDEAYTVFDKVFALVGNENISILADSMDGGWGIIAGIFLDGR